jgi:uncharacterized membrane protein YfhO
MSANDQAGVSVWHRIRAGALAAVLVLVSFTSGAAYRGWYPFFGTRSRNTNDLGDQFIPMHGYFRDLLTGNAHGDLFVNWQSGFGVPFLPDYYTYLGSPFALLVVLFPRSGMDAALFVITLAKYMAAAAAMTMYLKRLGRGPWWLLGLLGAAYALCGWAIDDAAYVPMWIDGMIYLPLLCLAAEWRIEKTRFLPAVLIVVYGWWANFYVGYMATLAAGLIILARLLVRHTDWRDTIASALRVAAPIACGVGLLLPLLVPTFMATRTGQPGFSGATPARPVSELLSRLLPASEGVGATAGIYVGTMALLLVCSLPFHSAVPRRVRLTWTVLPILVALSMCWTPTSIVWNFFDKPDGSRYRMAFVLCAVLVIAAWHAVIHGLPSLKALLAGSAILAALALITRNSPLLSRYAVVLLAVASVVAVAGLIITAQASKAVAAIAAIACLATFFAEETLTGIFVDQRRSVGFAPAPAWNAVHDQRRALIQQVDAYPQYRTDTGVPPLILNDPMLLGGEGAGYYSSLIPAKTFETLANLGYPNITRVVEPADNPVLDTIFSVGARVRTDAEGRQMIVTRQAPPIVTSRDLAWQRPGLESPFDRQEALLGTRVYSYPDAALEDVQRSDGWIMTRVRLSGCAAGQQLYFWSPGGYPIPGGIERVDAATGAPTAVTVKSLTAPDLTHHVFACLDRALLEMAAQGLTSTGATSVRMHGHTVEADLPARQGSSVAVLAVTNAPGWSCNSVAPQDFGGLLSVPLAAGQTHVSCSFEPPGLRLGLLGGALAVLATIVLAWVYRRAGTVGP